jgi:mercuric ion transport protein
MNSTSAKEISSLLLSKASPSFLNRVRVPLYIGGTTAVLASVCCIGPFFLVVPGISSSTILYTITLADPVRPALVVIAIVSLPLSLSYQRIWSSVPTPESRSVSASLRAKMVVYKIFFIIITMLVVAILMLPNIDFSTE